MINRWSHASACSVNTALEWKRMQGILRHLGLARLFGNRNDKKNIYTLVLNVQFLYILSTLTGSDTC